MKKSELRQIIKEEIKRVLKEATTPKSISIKLTDKWKAEHNLKDMPKDELEFSSVAKDYNYLGSNDDTIYIATYKDNKVFIGGLDISSISPLEAQKVKNELRNNGMSITPVQLDSEIKRSNLRKFPQAVSTFDKGFDTGVSDEKGYFKITKTVA